MTNTIKDQLWRLIKSLEKAEKRNFKIYATRMGGKETPKFVTLFDVLDRLEVPDDALVLRKMKLSSGQLSNLKRHLHHEILTSMRLLYIRKDVDIEIREQLDFVRILYGKGHYLDALRLLERAKAKAIEHNQDILQLEIIEFQKLIEARHITLSRQVDNKMDLLLNESAQKSYSFLNTSELFNLNIQIHGHYIEKGHSRTPEDHKDNEDFWFNIQAPRVDRDSLTETFHQQINRFQAAMWYNYIQLRLDESMEAARNAVALFLLNTQMILKDPDLFQRSLYYITALGFLNGDEALVARYTRRMKDFLHDEDIQLNINSRRIGETYYYLAQHNLLFLRQDYAGVYELSREVAAAWTEGSFRPNNHRWGLFLYKRAAACFLVKAFDEAIDYLNEIINMKTGVLREDLLINTRLLHALCNYELDNHSLVEYHLTGLNRLLRRSRDAAEVHRLGVTGLRKLIKALPAERGAIYPVMLDKIEEQAQIPFEAKALSYLDLRDWLRQHCAVNAAVIAS